MKTDLESSSNEELTTIDLDLDEEAMLIATIIMNEGRRREREEIISALMTKYDESCCCDSSSFGEHYLAHRQPDNLIDLINSREIK